jgi:hemolysin III
MTKYINVRLEEIINSTTHFIGFGLSIAATVLMIVHSSFFGTATSIVGASVFGAGLIFLYLASTLFHAARNIRIKYYLNKMDHSAIYILIAATYTPFTLVTLHGAWGWSIFGAIWGMAVFGVLFKIFWYKVKYRALSAWAYVGMGLTIIIAVKPLVERMPTNGLIWLAIGGAAYILGVLFYLSKRIPFAHGILHLFCIAGSFAHFWSAYHYVLPNESVFSAFIF